MTSFNLNRLFKDPISKCRPTSFDCTVLYCTSQVLNVLQMEAQTIHQKKITAPFMTILAFLWCLELNLQYLWAVQSHSEMLAVRISTYNFGGRGTQFTVNDHRSIIHKRVELSVVLL